MTTQDEQPFIACLNYCMVDQETGYCLTCGRPPVPVTPFKPFDAEFKSSLMEKLMAGEPGAPPGNGVAAKGGED